MSKDEKKPAAAAQPQSAGPQKLLMAGVVVILVALGFIVWLIASGRGGTPAAANNTAEAAAPQMPNRGRLLPSGLRFESISEGSGPLVQATDTVLLRYELRIVGRDGVVDGNMSDPQATPMSPGETVPGFTEALTMMRAGGEARFWVPPNLGYGSQPRAGGPIGPNDILEFHVKVERIAPAGQGAPSADGNTMSNTISEEDLRNIMAAMNAAEPAGGR
jgi:hypothetical protein